MTSSEGNAISKDFTVIPLDSDLVLAFSKTNSDSLPITSFKMAQSYPCVNPQESEDNGLFYPTEVARNFAECGRINDEQYDRRYTTLGNLKIN